MHIDYKTERLACKWKKKNANADMKNKKKMWKSDKHNIQTTNISYI